MITTDRRHLEAAIMDAFGISYGCRSLFKQGRVKLRHQEHRNSKFLSIGQRSTPKAGIVDVSFHMAILATLLVISYENKIDVNIGLGKQALCD